MTQPLFDSICHAVETDGLCEAGQTIVLAVSGGADSVGMARAMWQLNRERGWDWRLAVGHLHHGLRGAEADADEAFVRELAEELGLEFLSERVDVRALAEERRLSVEAAAREARYAFLARCARQVGADRVAVGHTADDQAETVLFRVVRGTGLRGLAGMPASRPLEGGPAGCRLIRPLLTVRRSQVVAYLESEGQAWREDASNRNRHYSRNFLRHEIIPALAERLNPQVVEAVTRLAGLAERMRDYLDAQARKAIGESTECLSKEEVTLHVEALAKLHPILRAEVLRLGLERLGVGLRALDQATLDRLVTLIDTPGAVDTAVGVRAERVGEHVILRSVPPHGCGAAMPPDEPFRVPLAVPGRTELPVGGAITVQPAANEPGLLERFLAEKDAGEEVMDADRLEGELFVRSRRDGDRLVPLGMSGTRKLQDLLVDLKVPARQRERVPILCDADGPVWVVPYRLADRVRVDGDTRRLLRVRYDPGREDSTRRHDEHDA